MSGIMAGRKLREQAAARLAAQKREILRDEFAKAALPYFLADPIGMTFEAAAHQAYRAAAAMLGERDKETE